MYVARVQYEGCCSFQDANSQGSSQPDCLFNLTQNYYYIVSDASNISQQNTAEESVPAKE